jgi:hypothetical protein
MRKLEKKIMLIDERCELKVKRGENPISPSLGDLRVDVSMS